MLSLPRANEADIALLKVSLANPKLLPANIAASLMTFEDKISSLFTTTVQLGIPIFHRPADAMPMPKAITSIIVLIRVD